MNKIILFLTILFFPVNSFAQRISNVYPQAEGEKIKIYYDLTGISEDRSVFIKVFMSSDGGLTYGDPLKSVTGDVGLVEGPGKNRCIVWDVYNDLDDFLGVNIKFKVSADMMEPVNSKAPTVRPFKLSLNTNLGSRSILNYKSFGLNLKGTIHFDRIGLGVRADLYNTFRQDINYTDGLNTYPDTGSYWGYSGGAIFEYDLIRSYKYSLYPFLYIGQSKVIYKYNQEFKEDEFFKYTIFGSLGLGVDINVYKFLYFGMEIEYLISPWFDLVPSESMDEGLDGLNIGFVIKFMINTG